MRARINSLSQELVDYIVKFIVDDIEACTDTSAYTISAATLQRNTFALRLLNRNFNRAFLVNIFRTRQAQLLFHLKYCHHDGDLEHSSDCMPVVNTSMVVHPLFRMHGKSLRMLIPSMPVLRLYNLMYNIERPVVQCQSLCRLEVITDWQPMRDIRTWNVEAAAESLQKETIKAVRKKTGGDLEFEIYGPHSGALAGILEGRGKKTVLVWRGMGLPCNWVSSSQVFEILSS